LGEADAAHAAMFDEDHETELRRPLSIGRGSRPTG
jgi:hypothetical protein